MNIQERGYGKKACFKYIVSALILCFISFVVLDPIQKIEVGQRGIIYNNLKGEVDEKQLNDGWHFVMPFVEELMVYPITERTYSISRNTETWLNGQDTSLWIPTNDRQKVGLDILFTYKFDENNLENIYERFQGKDIDTIEIEFLDSWFRHSAISIVTQSSLYDIYSEKRGVIQEDILTLLKNKLETSGINVEAVLINEVRLTPESEAVLLAEARKQKAIIEAIGKSEVNQLISKSLTENLIKLQMLEKLSANLKLVVVPGTADNQLNLDSIINNLAGEDEEFEDNKNKR